MDFEFGNHNFFENLGNGHPDHSLLGEELGKSLTVFRPPSVHAMQHLVEHILNLQLNLFLGGGALTSKPIAAETNGEDMIPADLVRENTNLDKLEPLCTTLPTQSRSQENVV